MTRPLRGRAAPLAAVGLVLVVTACASPEPVRTPVAERPPLTEAAPSATPDSPPRGPMELAGAPVDVVTGLSAPWSVVPLPDGSALLSERDRARLLELTADGAVREIGGVPGAAPLGEGGVLGLAIDPAGFADDPAVYVAVTTSGDNRILRLALDGPAGSRTLGAVEEVLTGIPASRTHNGGRLAFGPDGMLYATTGDAGDPSRAQDPASLAGKILRLTPDGEVPADNPTPGSYVYSLGHRNPQGLAWDQGGRLWAAEFGQNTWDELNRIDPGANYGWPIVEGVGGDTRFVDPVQQWPTSEASPSGLAIVGDTLFLASLRGQRLWQVDLDDPGRSTPLLVGELGRLRDAVAAPDGSLWLLTNNTDGRGEPRAGDDRLVSVSLQPRTLNG